MSQLGPLHIGYLSFFGDGEWVQQGGGSYSWVANEAGGGSHHHRGDGGSSFGGYVGDGGRDRGHGHRSRGGGGGRSQYHEL
jgi:hypothetical protein